MSGKIYLIQSNNTLQALSQQPYPNEDLFIAWLETGPNSVISHDSALALYDLSDALPAAIHLTVPLGLATASWPAPAYQPDQSRGNH